MAKVIIDTKDNLLYKSFYIYALERKFGKSNVSYSSEPFAGLNNIDTRGIAFIIKDGLSEKKIFIHANDSHEILKTIYNWCDVYGHANSNIALTDKAYQSKLIPLCPSFAIRCWNAAEASFHYLSNVKTCGLTPRKSLGQHYHMLLRAPYSNYHTRRNEGNGMIFFLSTLWYNDQWNNNDSGVNLSRANFIRACKSYSEIDFFGGFAAQSNNRSSVSLFKDCMYEKGECSTNTWINKTQKSEFVFNTPAFLNCHGWKLGEYLAMGKAIISTKLFNDLPQPLTDGENIHFVENTQEAIYDAVKFMHNNVTYRERLKIGAWKYWQEFGSPEATLHRLGI